MDFLKAEIARKKRQIESSEVLLGPDKKYFKRGDLAAKQEQEYLQKHETKKAESDGQRSQVSCSRILYLRI